jgi:transposase-like protein
MVKHIDIKSMVNARKARGMLLLEKGFEPNEINPHTWTTPSQKSNGSYTIIHGEHNRWSCTCKDFELKGIPCKHIYAVRIWRDFKEKFEKILTKEKQNIKSIELRIGKCKFCNSTEIIKYGKSCNRKFVNNIHFENMKYSPKIIALTLDLYFKGVSLRKISHHLKEFYSLNICYKSVYNWIEKYVSIMNEYVNDIQPNIGEVWHTDEMMVSIGGNWEYLWNIMDERTRFQLASVVSKERYIRDARMVFQRAKKNCGGRKPKYIITDGLQAYKRAVKKEFITNTHETEHLWNVGLQHHPNNNHIERLHGNIRDREKTMRGLKIENTPIVEGHRLYYNFIKPHESLNGRTPSEETGITIEGNNKWLNLMTNAINYQRQKNKLI